MQTHKNKEITLNSLYCPNCGEKENIFLEFIDSCQVDDKAIRVACYCPECGTEFDLFYRYTDFEILNSREENEQC